ncbi:Nascent polypeptide-associated complex protein [Geodia barretti]|uniref:Transcription factor BTF3 n=2 Tax=Geodia barretti TaxID=519541 RepID=A0AA35XB29_GEOBA|nr:Nascent polypeptide-associated complex protein [Geodia barretti]
MMRGGNRKMRRQMDKMGLQMEEVSDVQEVIIKTDKIEIILSKPQVSKMQAKEGGALYTVSADNYEERELEVQIFSDEDIRTVCERAGVDEERAKGALAEAEGDIVNAILLLQ